LIRSSCLFRGPNDSQDISKAPLSISRRFNVKHRKGRYIFAGPIEQLHYGHFVIEGLSRIWFYLMHQTEVEKCELICNLTIKQNIKHYIKLAVKKDKPRIIHKFKNYIDLPKLKLFSSPVSVGEVVIPNPSFSDRGKAYKVHTLVFDVVAKKVLENIQLKRTDTPLYVSRTKLIKANRHIENEVKLEEYILSVGGKIIYPEQLTLEEQIILFNKHKCIIGCLGSALHTLLFSNYGNTRVIYLTPPFVCDNYFKIDKMKDFRGTYINCIESVNNSYKELSLNTEKAIRYLKELL